VQSFDLEKFFQDNNCKVRQVRLVMDKSHLRHKGVAYVEFIDESFVRSAVALTGSKFMGIPLIIQLTETEKNRLAQLQNNNSSSDLGKKSAKIPLADPGLACIQLDFVHPSVEEFTLRQLLRPFGHLENVRIVKDTEGKPRGTAFCKYKNPLDAKEAVAKLQDYLLVGQRLKLALVKDSIARFNEGSEAGAGEEELNLTAQARTELMLQWARSKNILPGKLVIRNLPGAAEHEAGYNLEADLRVELERYGSLKELIVMNGEAIVEFADMDSAGKAQNALNGRFFAYRQLKVDWKQ
jgi:RNA-binding protein 39